MAPERWKRLGAFAVIYFVWGSTFLAIRVGVREAPPFLFAAMRFSLAGAALLGWAVARREPMPRRREWGSATALAFLIFVLDYGSLFWAEQRVPSGVAAVMMATIPVFMALSEIALLRTQRMTWRLAAALAVGVLGVAVLIVRSWDLGGAAVDPVGSAALIVASASWSLSSALTRRLALPASKVVSSGSQMLAGGALLIVVAAVAGEFRGFDPGTVPARAWVALAYLTGAGSILGFTAYLWLLHRESPTRVGTYAYVNPVVAVLVGYFFGGEELGLRTVIGAPLVLVSVIAIMTRPAR
jgi:drug/metabolite transporter (DMT)-like permease